MADASKRAQVAKRVMELTAQAVRKLKDPRVGMVTITDARMTPDLREATVFYTVLGDDEQVKASAAGLEHATGHLRTTVGRALGMRHTPSLQFVADTVPDQAHRIEELLAKAAAADAEVHKIAEGAAYAGDPNPYVVDEDDEETAEEPPR
ncbi:30S ribosome-binding factor RbfA [Glycomyces sp. TRM65418]|uniref:30S ribosome-binding factor RbfA n=1 Tax=Glycomyces sp. TRM65418 TaxID=2867006 RepID=UPI001CE63501|nr:30S ribosome-binding factor RbfA [Glycomyces sp. TRM65418]MCC3762175.1 30S ribosome-binding factor RbfA [Glycomyces sp. TRM65418]QZD56236.1 30S ribosome-binding factor RbfA [Glycomyces sp. TRM65418]